MRWCFFALAVLAGCSAETSVKNDPECTATEYQALKEMLEQEKDRKQNLRSQNYLLLFLADKQSPDALNESENMVKHCREKYDRSPKEHYEHLMKEFEDIESRIDRLRSRINDCRDYLTGVDHG